MLTTQARSGALAALALTALLSAPASPREAFEGKATQDPLAAEIASLRAYLAGNTASGEL